MGLFDPDTTSVISRRSSRHGSKHHHGKEYKVVMRGDRDRSRERDRSRNRSRSRSRSHSRARSSAGSTLARSFFGLDNSSRRSHHHHGSSSHHHNKSTASFFSLPNVSSRSFFGGGGSGGGGHRGSASYYRRSPRSSFLQRAFRKLKRLLRDLVYYAKKHPWRVFVLAVLPLLTGGALTALLARFGVRLPPKLMRMLEKLGVGARAVSGDHIGLVGDAVRMAGAGGLAKAGVASLQRGRNGTMQWDRRVNNERDYFGGRGGHGGGGGGGGGSGGGSGGWGESISRMFS